MYWLPEAQVPILFYSLDCVSHETLIFETHYHSHVSFTNNDNFNIPTTLYTVRILRDETMVHFFNFLLIFIIVVNYFLTVFIKDEFT